MVAALLGCRKRGSGIASTNAGTITSIQITYSATTNAGTMTSRPKPSTTEWRTKQDARTLTSYAQVFEVRVKVTIQNADANDHNNDDDDDCAEILASPDQYK